MLAVWQASIALLCLEFNAAITASAINFEHTAGSEPFDFASLGGVSLIAQLGSDGKFAFTRDHDGRLLQDVQDDATPWMQSQSQATPAPPPPARPGTDIRPAQQGRDQVGQGAAKPNPIAAKFQQFLQSMPWRQLNFAKARMNRTLVGQVQQHLLTFLEQEPLVPRQPGKESCAGPPSGGWDAAPIQGALQDSLAAQTCQEADTDIFTGTMFAHPKTLVDIVLFSYELDVLEIRLNELGKVVDYFVLVEMAFTFKGIPKPSLWARNRKSSRFADVASKVVHVFIDGPGAHQLAEAQTGTLNWHPELYQTRRGWELVGSLIKKLGLEDTDTVKLYGDADEIPAFKSCWLMKHCERHDPQVPLSNGIWMPMGRLDYALSTDFPVTDLPYTFRNPTWQPANGTRLVGRFINGPHLLGGVHLTYYNYFPFILQEALSCTECHGIGDLNLPGLLRAAEASSASSFDTAMKCVFQARTDLQGSLRVLADRLTPLQTVISQDPCYREVMYLPQYLRCNWERFPAWFGRTDPRLLFGSSSSSNDECELY